MLFHGSLHFNVITVVRGKKIRADQQEDYIRYFEMFTDFTVHLFPSNDTAIVPSADYTLAFQRSKMNLKLVTKVLISM
jgi:hypothetical protein